MYLLSKLYHLYIKVICRIIIIILNYNMSTGMIVFYIIFGIIFIGLIFTVRYFNGNTTQRKSVISKWIEALENMSFIWFITR